MGEDRERRTICGLYARLFSPLRLIIEERERERETTSIAREER